MNGVYRIVPITVGIPEAAQLGFAMEGIRTERPTTHDLFMDALTNLDCTVHKVEITDMEGRVFFARLFLRTEGRIIELDARPSDAIALATRQNAPILMSEDVLNQSAIPYSFNTKADEEEEMEKFRKFIDKLDPEDFLTEEGE